MNEKNMHLFWLSSRNFFRGGQNLLLCKFLLLFYCFRTKFQGGAKVFRGANCLRGHPPCPPMWKKASLFLQGLSYRVLSEPGKRFDSQPSSAFKLILLPPHCCYGLDVKKFVYMYLSYFCIKIISDKPRKWNQMILSCY